MVPFLRREKLVIAFIAYQIYPANASSMIADRRRMPGEKIMLNSHWHRWAVSRW
jgi:hypothetical protein